MEKAIIKKKLSTTSPVQKYILLFSCQKWILNFFRTINGRNKNNSCASQYRKSQASFLASNLISFQILDVFSCIIENKIEKGIVSFQSTDNWTRTLVVRMVVSPFYCINCMLFLTFSATAKLYANFFVLVFAEVKNGFLLWLFLTCLTSTSATATATSTATSSSVTSTSTWSSSSLQRPQKIMGEFIGRLPGSKQHHSTHKYVLFLTCRFVWGCIR